MGSFAAQRYVIDHSDEIDGLILSGSGALEDLARAALPEAAGSNLLNAAFEPASTPFDWLSRDQAIVNAFMVDPLCFEDLHPDSLVSFLGAAPQLYDPLHSARSAAIYRSICSPEAKTPSDSTCADSEN